MTLFNPIDATKLHPVKSGESILTISTENQVTWQEFSELNWGTKNPLLINLSTYNQVGSRKPKGDFDPPDPNVNYQFSNVDKLLGTGTVRIPEKFAKAGLSVDQTHIIRVKNWIADLQWTPREGHCGDKVKLTGSTNLPDGTKVVVALKALKGESTLLTGFEATAAGGKIEKEWEVKNVSFKEGAAHRDWVEVEATASAPTATSRKAYLTVKAYCDADEQTFDANRAWSGFTNHSRFTQKMEKFRNKVGATFDILKAWGGYYIDLSSAGVTGLAGGCPWAGYRWGRAVGANPQAPDQYYDGANWVALPAGFVLTGTNHSAIGFYKQGANFVSTSGGTYPGAFADYDFNSAIYTQRRADWISNTHTKWTEIWHVRRKDCKSDAAVHCCRYDVDVTLTFNVVAAYAAEVICVCPGNLRSNAAIWFMDDARIEVAAHESGHHMDNPDEYAGGAVDTTLNGDGAVNGIDADCLMGQNLTKVKKRHYHAFAEMTKRLVKAKYGKDYEYEAVERK